jgi:NAD(P)-dependent dehydrogenase (short-subunit alcohol dehydrogenase family)
MANAVPDKILSEMKRKIALRKLGSPDDVADLCCFLASSRSSYITGETMECSGMLRL